ncbi:MAG: alpha/beta family hydrolase [Clostridia bacterium]
MDKQSPPPAANRAVFVCAHGAGGHKDDAAMLRVDRVLSPQGFDVVRFNFSYREKGLRRIDPMPVLKSFFQEVIQRERREKQPLIIGGRSMGGRVASVLAAEGLQCDGLLLLAYPLHPAGQPEKLRDAHLPAIRCPVLCINGTRDALCDKPLMERALVKLGGHWRMHWIAGADHSFKVLKSSGRTEADVDAEIGAAAGAWLQSLARAAP